MNEELRIMPGDRHTGVSDSLCVADHRLTHDLYSHAKYQLCPDENFGAINLPNDHLTAEDVYQRFAMSYIASHDDLNILNCCNSKQSPTRAPNWAEPMFDPFIKRGIAENLQLYNASRGYTCEYKKLPSISGSFELSGLMWTRVELSHSTLLEEDFINDHELRREHQDLMSHLPPTSSSERKFWSTLAAGYNDMLGGRSHFNDVSNMQGILDFVTDKVPPSSSLTPNPVLKEHSVGRHLFLTETARWDSAHALLRVVTTSASSSAVRRLSSSEGPRTDGSR